MVLVDSSIWIAVERAEISVAQLSANRDVVTCPTVVLEVLRGVSTPKRYRLAREMFLLFGMLDSPTPLERFEQAAQLYLQCRAGGVTPSVPDCLVAACAIAHKIPLLHDDADFEHIARFTSLKTIPATRS